MRRWIGFAQTLSEYAVLRIVAALRTRISAVRSGWSLLNRARARGLTGVPRHGGPLLFRFLAKQRFRNLRENFLRVPPEKRPLALEA